MTPAGQRWTRSKQTIWNLRGTVPEGVMRVDRKTIWGNPFVMYDEGQRETVCNQFDDYARKRHKDDPQWLAPLRGKDLACWCAPKRCHAETLIELANGPLTPNETTE